MSADQPIGRLEANARAFQVDPQLEPIADLFHTDRDRYDRLPPSIKSQLDVYSDLRDSYRRAVAAGVVPDDRGPSAA